MDESQRVVWHTPTEYDALKHGPSYLPKAVRTKEAKQHETPLVVLLSTLKAASIVHQAHHWSTMGKSAYADHLLFERLYNESQEAIDQVAERAIGTQEVNLIQAYEFANGVLIELRGLTDESPTVPDTMVALSLRAEYKVLEQLNWARANLGERLTPGVSNLLDGVYDKHETFVYLLKQRSTTAYDYNRRPNE